MFLVTHTGGTKLSDYDKLEELIKNSKHIVSLTGAGVSTLSGIRDFRSSNGIYTEKFGKISVEELLDISFFRKNPGEFYSWAKGEWYKMHDYEPSIIHKVLKVMEDKGKLSGGIFTQNIDGLHTRCGSKNVKELHGSIEKGVCLGCGEKFTFDYMKKLVDKDIVPICPYCGSLIKPDIVFYGEGLDSRLLDEGEYEFSSSDLVLVLGSSLVVNPAASLPYISYQNGKKIVLVNRDDTYLDNYSTLHFRDLSEFGEKLLNILDRF